jgi:hypothetical protein
MKQRRILFIGFGVGVVVALIAVGAVLVLRSQDDIVPADIKKQVSFDMYLPHTSDKSWQVAPDTVQFNAKTGVLTATATRSSNAEKVTITQQNQPDTFNDIPGYYEKMLQALNQYSIIHVGLGTFTLTHPTEAKGGQTAVALINGTLLFITPDDTMSDAQWRDFLSTFKRIN